jgi:hypothetical protein
LIKYPGTASVERNIRQTTLFLAMLLVTLFLSGFLAGCAIKLVSPPVPLADSSALAIPEEELLDLSIRIFTPLNEFTDVEDINITNLRNAEALYASSLLANILQASKHWGAIRLNHNDFSAADVRVSGAVLQSDGESMRLRINVRDSRGLVWFDKQYLQVLEEGYPLNPENNQAPFQSMFTQIANDIRNYAMTNFDAESLRQLRNVSLMDFAASFAPDSYQSYLEPDRNGLAKVTRLPAANDGIFEHIISIRDRHNTFLDALQQQYTTFLARVEVPYHEFIRLSYIVTQNLNGVMNQREQEAWDGVPVFGSVTEDPVDNYRIEKQSGSRVREVVFKSNRLNRGARQQIYSLNLAVSGQVFEQEISPLSIEVNDQTIELTGTVEEQYQQWQDIFREMIALELGAD